MKCIDVWQRGVNTEVFHPSCDRGRLEGSGRAFKDLCVNAGGMDRQEDSSRPSEMKREHDKCSKLHVHVVL